MFRWRHVLVISLLLSMLWPWLPVKSSASTDTSQEPGQVTVFDYPGYLPLIRKRGNTPSLYGIEVTGYPTSSDYLKIKDTGAYFTRYNGVLWANVEPSEGERKWEALADFESSLKEYARLNMKVMVIVRRTPAWAQKVPGSWCGPVKAEKLGAFANFMRDLVTRYSQPAYPPIYWEIWNEPDVFANTSDFVFGCWGDPNDEYYGGGYYASMLKVVYPAIKSANPSAQVLIGGLLLDCSPELDRSCWPGRFYEGILRNNGGAYFDGVSFHAYDGYLSNYQYQNKNWRTSQVGKSITRAKLEFLQNVSARWNVTGKYFVNSETALMCASSACDAGFESTKAFYAARSFAEALVLGLRANIWYDLGGAWRLTGLLSNSVPLPAYTAYSQSVRELATAQYIRDISQAGVQGYEFKTPERRVWVLWSADGAAHDYPLNGIPYAVLDVYGKMIPTGSSVTVTQSPVYVRWIP